MVRKQPFGYFVAGRKCKDLITVVGIYYVFSEDFFRQILLKCGFTANWTEEKENQATLTVLVNGGVFIDCKSKLQI